jgi:hypothetical protein
MGIILLAPRVWGVIIQNPSFILDVIAFAENYFLNEGKWVSRESFQGAGFLIVSVPIHDP